jgi:hypothetical protein
MTGFMSINGLGSARNIGPISLAVTFSRIQGYRTLPDCSATPL